MDGCVRYDSSERRWCQCREGLHALPKIMFDLFSLGGGVFSYRLGHFLREGMKPSPALGMRHPDLNILQMLDYQGKYLASIKSDEARKKQIPRSSEGGDKTHPYRVLQALPLVSSQPMTIFLELLTSLTNYEPIGSQEISSAPSFRYHTYRQEMAMLQQSNSEISLYHFQTYHLGFPNGPFQLAKWTVSRPKTVRFRTRNGMY